MVASINILNTLNNTTAILNNKTNSADAASNFDLKSPLLWGFDPLLPLATLTIMIDTTACATSANPTTVQTNLESSITAVSTNQQNN